MYCDTHDDQNKQSLLTISAFVLRSTNGSLLRNLRNQSYQIVGAGLNVVEMKPIILMHQLSGGLAQSALSLFPGNLCLVKTCLAKLLQCSNLLLCSV